MNTTSVDSYLQDGCGRCEHYRTPQCKVHRWTDILVVLREILVESELTEQMKWGCPCYTLDGKNVLMLSSLNDHCVISFFKGAALLDEDEDGVLESAGPNSRIARLITFRSIDDVTDRLPQIVHLIERAIEVERAGTTIVLDDEPLVVPEELEARWEADPTLRSAFAALTPGRQRSHVLHIAGAKRSETRERRVDKCTPKILAGKGWNEW